MSCVGINNISRAHRFFYDPSPRSWCMCGAVVFADVEDRARLIVIEQYQYVADHCEFVSCFVWESR